MLQKELRSSLAKPSIRQASASNAYLEQGNVWRSPMMQPEEKFLQELVKQQQLQKVTRYDYAIRAIKTVRFQVTNQFAT